MLRLRVASPPILARFSTDWDEQAEPARDPVCSGHRRREGFEGGWLEDEEMSPVDATRDQPAGESAEEHPGEADEEQFTESEKRYYRSLSRSLCQ